MWKYLCYTVGFLFGSFMIFGGAFVFHTMPNIFSERIKANLPIVNGTDAYTRYTTPSVPLHVKMYLFNVTNPREVEAGAKPILNQVGPFSMTERRKKQVTSISPDNKTLDYKLFRSYFFEPKESPPLDVLITLPNAPVFSAFYAANQRRAEEAGLADPVEVVKSYLGNSSLYITKTADEWLFKGIDLDWLESLNNDGVILDDQPPDNKFGFLYKKNNTWDEKSDGVMTISTGVDGNMTNIGKVVLWNKKAEVSYWRGKHCNTIRGTDGQFFHPNIKKDEKLDIFAPDLCRTLSIEFVKTTSIRTIELYRFGISSSFFKPVDHDEQSKCYCTKNKFEDKKRFCKLGGVVDVSSCRKKPIVLSTPHFYNGDPLLREQVEGLGPNAASHDTYIDIEPMSGAVLRVRRRLQLNVEMLGYEGFTASEVLKEKPLIHPFVWLDQSIEVTDELAQKLENKLTKVVRLVKILCYAAMIAGPIILVATFIFICRDIRSEDKKVRSNKKGDGSQRDTGGDYQKVQVIMKPLNHDKNGHNDNN